MMAKPAMSEENAVILALDALAHLAGNDDLLVVFLNSTGLCESDLKTRLDDPDLLGAILDFLLMDDAWVLDFAQSTGRSADTIAAARAALPGGDMPHWT